MNIVVLDAYTTNPGDLDWQPLHALGDCTIFDRTLPTELPHRIRDAEAILLNKTRLDAAAIAAAPRLRYIGVLATGYNIVDLDAARARQIVVTNVPSYSTASTAQGAIALLLELTNHVGLHDRSVHAGDWGRQPDFCYWQRPILELAGLTLGIVGLGQIGLAVARTAAALGMTVIASSRSQRQGLREDIPGDRTAPPIRFVPLSQLFAQADVVSLHCALTPETAGLVNARILRTMKPAALLLNTARGGLIVESDLADALNTGTLAAAALDVLTLEPPDGTSPLLTARNCILTPHNHWASAASRQRLLHQVVANLRAWQDGRPIHVVSL